MRAAWRLFFHHRSLTGLAVGTLAVALGLGAALASVADAILWRPLPVVRPDEIVRIFTASAAQPFGLVSYPDFEDFRRASRTLRGIVAQSQVLIAAGDSPARVRMALAVTPEYFDLLGVSPAIGRSFRSREEADAVVILSNAFWKTEFGGSPRAIGGTLRLSGTLFTIIGVAPENFALDRFSHEDFYVPMGVYAAGILPVTGTPLTDRARRYLNVYARLAPGSNIEQARSEMAAIGARLGSEYPVANRGRRVLAVTEMEARTRMDRTMPALAATLAAVAALLVTVACANLALLLLARKEARGQEIAVRMAMGATPMRLLRESLSESAALTITGASLGAPLGYVATLLVARAATLPTDFSFAIAPRIDGRIALLLSGAAALIAMICGAISRQRPVAIAAALKARTGGPSSRSREALVAIEVALSTVLIFSSGFLLASIRAAERIDTGYRTDHVLVLALDPAQVRYGEAQARVFYNQILERTGRLRGARGAVLAQSAPLGYTGAQRQIVIGEETMTLWMNIVGPGYFELMHLPLIEGRGFEDSDTASAPMVAVVNQELAKRCGVGCTFRMNARQVRVIGVARTAKYFQLGEQPRPYFYLPFSQNYVSRMVLHVATEGDPAAMVHAIVDEIHRTDAAQPVSEIRALDTYVKQGAMFQARLGLLVLAAVGLGAILLAVAGLFVVISHSVTRRRREIGIRIAVGARRRDVLFLVATDGLKLVLAGIVGGWMAALGVSRLLAGISGNLGGFQPSILALSAVVVIFAAAPACLIPAWKSSRVDPILVLRAD